MQAQPKSPLQSPAVAYFSAEYAIADDMPIYAGGLGILAADIVMEAAAQDRQFCAVGLIYHESFTGDDPDQRPMVERLSANGFELAVTAGGERQTVVVMVAKRKVRLQAWVKHWGNTSLVLLDARLPENDERDQQISDHLYASDPTLGFAQEICLGFGGVAMLEALGFQADVLHLNEGHTALAGLATILSYLGSYREMSFGDVVMAVKPRLVGTKHTILSGAGLFMDWAAVERLIGSTLEASGAKLADLQAIASRAKGDYSDTKLLVSICERQSGVSKIHTKAEKRDHPSSVLVPITNGIFPGRWMSGVWGSNPLEFDDAKLWAMHSENRRQLLEHVREQTGKVLKPDVLTVVWARRMAAYKRPELVVSDVERLAAILNNTKQPVQLIVAGQANPADLGGVNLMIRVIEASRRPDLAASFAYLPHYNPVSAKFLVRGADLWLNTPIRGYEACGTSGMKASLNGALQLSTSDGWVDEIDLSKIGWELPDIGGSEAPAALYTLIQDRVAPVFYDQTAGLPVDWIQLMRANIALISKEFTAERMLDEYYSKLYERA